MVKYASFAALALVCIAMQWCDFYLPPATVYDEGIRATGAFCVREGRLPYRDFYNIYGFLEFYLGAAGLALFGHSLTPLRGLRIVAHTAMALSGALLAGRLVGDRPHWAARVSEWATALLIVPLIGSSCDGVLAAALAAWAACARYHECGRIRHLLAAAVCCAIGAWFRPDMSLGAMVLMFGTLVWRAVRVEGEVSNRRAAWRDAALFALIAVGMSGAGYAPFLILDSAAVWQCMVVHPAASLAARRLPFPDIGEAFFTWYWLHIVVIAVAIVVLVLRVGTKRVPGGASGPMVSGPAPLGVALFGMLLWPYAAGRADLNHQVPALVVAAVLVPMVCARLLAARRRGIGAIAALLLAAYAIRSHETPTLLSRMGEASLDWPTAHRVALPSAGSIQLDESSPEFLAARFVRDRYPGESQMFCGLQRHDRVFINDLLMYFLAEKLPAVRDHHFDPGVTDTAAIQQRMIDDLNRHRPRVAILWRGVDSGAGGETAPPGGSGLLDAYLAGCYQMVAEFGPYRVMQRGDPTGESSAAS